MQLMERLWAVVISVVSTFSLSPLLDGRGAQTALQLPLPVSPVTQTKDNPCAKVDYPCFSPPGAPDDFFCKYPKLKGWKDCSHELDRRCWIRETKTGRQLDINTDYENIWPDGITRNYNLDLADSWWAADGLNFTEAKLFNNSYPGPWIQACWGDR
jgi:hypothetical protein